MHYDIEEKFGLLVYQRLMDIVCSGRRTFATNVYNKLEIVQAKNFLTHSDIKTTMHYLNVKDDGERVDYGL